MNKSNIKYDAFLKFVEASRDCEDTKLDAAVNAGLRRARAQRGRVDSRRILMLAAASVFTVAMCFTVNLRLFKTASEAYYESRQKTMPGAGAALDAYIKTMTDKIEAFAKFEFRTNTLLWR
jgi:predicted RNase H-like nuclease